MEDSPTRRGHACWTNGGSNENLLFPGFFICRSGPVFRFHIGYTYQGPLNPNERCDLFLAQLQIAHKQLGYLKGQQGKLHGAQLVR